VPWHPPSAGLQLTNLPLASRYTTWERAEPPGAAGLALRLPGPLLPPRTLPPCSGCLGGRSAEPPLLLARLGAGERPRLPPTAAVPIVTAAALTAGSGEGCLAVDVLAPLPVAAMVAGQPSWCAAAEPVSSPWQPPLACSLQ
jgi:hypothetical protein